MKLTVVLAVQGGADRLPSVLRALAEQMRDGVEVLVVYAGEEDDVEASSRPYSFCTPVRGARGALTPELWRDGIERGRGERVALTIVHCEPPPGWIDRLLDADLDTYVGVGGALQNASGSDAVSWAIFLLRYIRYAPPLEARETLDIPGDNAVYDRKALLEHADAFADGFWENEIHPRLARDGRRILLDPALQTEHRNGYSTAAFFKQRFRHGVRFGRQRAAQMRPVRRLLYLSTLPLVPVIFGSKIVGAVAKSEQRGHLLPALPYLVLFVDAWALGEAAGAVSSVVMGTSDE